MPKFQFQFKFLFKNNLKTLTKISDEHKKNWIIGLLQMISALGVEPLKVHPRVHQSQSKLIG
jgi:hypothetical protein